MAPRSFGGSTARIDIHPAALTMLRMDQAVEMILLPQRTSALRQVPWKWWHVAIAFSPLLASRGLQLLINAGLLPPMPWLRLPASVFMHLWILGYPLYVARRQGRAPRPPGPVRTLIEVLLAAPTWFVLLMTLVFIMLFVRMFVPIEPPANPLEQYSQGSPVLMICFAAIAVAVAPISEETLFRGLLYNWFRRGMPVPLAAAIQGLLFGFLHTYSLTHSAIVSVLGIGLALIYEWRRTLLASMLVHALQNTFVAVVTFAMLAMAAENPALGITGEPDTGGCRVTAIVPGGAAEEAGLRVEDIITSIDDQLVADINAIIEVVQAKQPGDAVAIELHRAGEPLHLKATLKRKGW